MASIPKCSQGYLAFSDETVQLGFNSYMREHNVELLQSYISDDGKYLIQSYKVFKPQRQSDEIMLSDFIGLFKSQPVCCIKCDSNKRYKVKNVKIEVANYISLGNNKLFLNVIAEIGVDYGKTR